MTPVTHPFDGNLRELDTPEEPPTGGYVANRPPEAGFLRNDLIMLCLLCSRRLHQSCVNHGDGTVLPDSGNPRHCARTDMASGH